MAQKINNITFTIKDECSQKANHYRVLAGKLTAIASNGATIKSVNGTAGSSSTITSSTATGKDVEVIMDCSSASGSTRITLNYETIFGTFSGFTNIDCPTTCGNPTVTSQGANKSFTWKWDSTSTENTTGWSAKVEYAESVRSECPTKYGIIVSINSNDFKYRVYEAGTTPGSYTTTTTTVSKNVTYSIDVVPAEKNYSTTSEKSAKVTVTAANNTEIGSITLKQEKYSEPAYYKLEVNPTNYGWTNGTNTTPQTFAVVSQYIDGGTITDIPISLSLDSSGNANFNCSNPTQKSKGNYEFTLSPKNTNETTTTRYGTVTVKQNDSKSDQEAKIVNVNQVGTPPSEYTLTLKSSTGLHGTVNYGHPSWNPNTLNNGYEFPDSSGGNVVKTINVGPMGKKLEFYTKAILNSTEVTKKYSFVKFRNTTDSQDINNGGSITMTKSLTVELVGEKKKYNLKVNFTNNTAGATIKIYKGNNTSGTLLATLNSSTTTWNNDYEWGTNIYVNIKANSGYTGYSLSASGFSSGNDGGHSYSTEEAFTKGLAFTTGYDGNALIEIGVGKKESTYTITLKPSNNNYGTVSLRKSGDSDFKSSSSTTGVSLTGLKSTDKYDIGVTVKDAKDYYFDYKNDMSPIVSSIGCSSSGYNFDSDGSSNIADHLYYAGVSVSSSIDYKATITKLQYEIKGKINTSGGGTLYAKKSSSSTWQKTTSTTASSLLTGVLRSDGYDLKAEASDGYQFDGYDGVIGQATSSNSNQINKIIPVKSKTNNTYTITAKFSKKGYTLTIEVNSTYGSNPGTITATIGSNSNTAPYSYGSGLGTSYSRAISFTSGDKATIVIKPSDDHYYVNKVNCTNITLSGVTLPNTLGNTVTYSSVSLPNKDCKVSVEFIRISKLKINFKNNNIESVKIWEVSSGSDAKYTKTATSTTTYSDVPNGKMINFTVKPKDGYTASWSTGSSSGSESGYLYLYNDDITLDVSGSIGQVTLTLNIGNGVKTVKVSYSGSWDKTYTDTGTKTISVDKGSRIQLWAEAKPNYFLNPFDTYFTINSNTSKSITAYTNSTFTINVSWSLYKTNKYGESCIESVSYEPLFVRYTNTSGETKSERFMDQYQTSQLYEVAQSSSRSYSLTNPITITQISFNMLAKWISVWTGDNSHYDSIGTFIQSTWEESYSGYYNLTATLYGIKSNGSKTQIATKKQSSAEEFVFNNSISVSSYESLKIEISGPD